jgi:hypothetical protein
MISMSTEEQARLAAKVKGRDKGSNVSINESRDTAERAYLIWEQAGCPDGKALEYWLQAEAELSTEPVEQLPSPNEVAMTPKRGERKKRGVQKNRSRR